MQNRIVLLDQEIEQKAAIVDEAMVACHCDYKTYGSGFWMIFCSEVVTQDMLWAHRYGESSCGGPLNTWIVHYTVDEAAFSYSRTATKDSLLLHNVLYESFYEYANNKMLVSTKSN